jgi:hypothetical protein
MSTTCAHHDNVSTYKGMKKIHVTFHSKRKQR